LYCREHGECVYCREEKNVVDVETVEKVVTTEHICRSLSIVNCTEFNEI
jgi:hypothetical protein